MSAATRPPSIPPKDGVAPVDEVLPPGELVTFGLQHVLGMYAGAVAVPLIVGFAFDLSPSDIGFLIAADIFAAGLATLVQTIGFRIGKIGFGARLPIMQGCTFAAVAPIVAVAGDQSKQLPESVSHPLMTEIFGAIIIAGIIAIFIAPVISKSRRFFPPLVVGTVILIIGVSLLPVASGWAENIGGKDQGAPKQLGLAAFTLILILAIQRFGNETLKRTSIMAGIVVGTIVAIPLGFTDFSNVGDSNVVGFPTPFHFGAPSFNLSIVITMLIVMIVSMVETTGDLIAVGEIVGKEADEQVVADGMRADGISSAIGGIFNTFPYTAYAENVGLVSLSGVKSRWVVAVAGGIMVILGLFPIVGAVVAAIPLPVLGGAGFVMFGTVAAIGAKTLNKVNFDDGANLIIVATALGIGLIPVGVPTIYDGFPEWFRTIAGSGISAGTITVVALNYFFNEAGKGKKTADALNESPALVGADEVAHARAVLARAEAEAEATKVTAGA
ncbi:MAG: nucleobase:cation symporter-2 family protein [Solirubrobacteraceae bacterium]|nr:nucleobase:cation symporter-2 family protein [Solirubrobacteraceae bacterium]